MFSHLSVDSLLGTQANDIWGWRDPVSGRHYALVGLLDGVTIVDITQPSQAIVAAKVNEPEFLQSQQKTISELARQSAPPTLLADGSDERKAASQWRDIKVLDNFMLVVSDNQPHGLQIFDLTRLRSLSEHPAQLQEDALYRRFGSAHNLTINEETGFAYVVGTASNTDECGSFTSLHMVDLTNPLTPSLAGCYADTILGNIVRPGYVHDTQCVVYDGPDKDFRGEEICFNSSETNFSITNVQDKSSAFTISAITYQGNEYAHQGWLTEDQRYFFLNDELDESRSGIPTSTHVFDLQELDTPRYLGAYHHDTFTIDHNLYIRQNFIYQSNYTSGLRVLKIDNPANVMLSQIGFFDTEPATNSVEFEGSWSNYPFFSNGIVIASDIRQGLFVLSDPGR